MLAGWTIARSKRPSVVAEGAAGYGSPGCEHAHLRRRRDHGRGIVRPRLHRRRPAGDRHDGRVWAYDRAHATLETRVDDPRRARDRGTGSRPPEAHIRSKQRNRGAVLPWRVHAPGRRLEIGSAEGSTTTS